MPNERQQIRRILSCIDLTNLDDACDEASIDQLCKDARTGFGPVASVCVWPRFVARAARNLSGSGVAVCSVADFPGGDGGAEHMIEEATQAWADGAREIDVVVPWKGLLQGRDWDIEHHVALLRQALPEACIKAILETGELEEPTLIRIAGLGALAGGADFLKTSTGKTERGATPEAVDVMLDAIRETDGPAGLKVSGGVRRISEALDYLQRAENAFGTRMTPRRFRIGASSLLPKILHALSGS